jgi:hypothetical protein
MNIYRIDYNTPDYGTDAVLLHKKQFSRDDLENMWKEFAAEHNLPRGGNYLFYKLSKEERDAIMDLEERLWPNPKKIKQMIFFSYWLIKKKGFVEANVVAYTPPTDI